MLLFICVVACASMASATELSSENNEIVARRQTDEVARVFELSAAVGTIQAELSVVQSNINSGSVNDIIARIADTATARAMESAEQQGVITTQIAGIQSQIAAMAAAQASTLQNIVTTNAASQAETSTLVSNQLAAINSQVTAPANSQAAAMSTAAERQEATFSNSMVAMTSTLTRSTTATATAMQTLNTSLTRAMMNKKSTTVHAWHGGCSSTQHGGWNNLCLDRNTYDNAMPYFRKRDNTRFLVASARVFILYNYFTINCSCNWAYSDLMINNAIWYRTHGHTTGWSWKDSHVVSTFKAVAGNTFWLRTHAACGRTSSYHYGTHQRLDITYVGIYAA